MRTYNADAHQSRVVLTVGVLHPALAEEHADCRKVHTYRARPARRRHASTERVELRF